MPNYWKPWSGSKGHSQDDLRIQRLRTHPGIGLLTALCLVHTLLPVARFRNPRKVVAYAGFDPVERSSGARQQFLGISKAGRAVAVRLARTGQGPTKVPEVVIGQSTSSGA